jgi:hypothetical protein
MARAGLVAAGLGLSALIVGAAGAQIGATTTRANPSALALPGPAAKAALYTRAQTRLKALGLYAGKINGKRDPATVAAIKRFQARQQLTVSGRLTPETLRALGA